MKTIRPIKSLFLVRDTEYNQVNFPASVGASFEAPITHADCLEYPADDKLTDIDFVNLAHVDSLADGLGFDAVRLAIYQDTVTFVIGRNGVAEHAFSLQTAHGFLNGVAYERENRTADLPTLAPKLKPVMIPDVPIPDDTQDGPNDRPLPRKPLAPKPSQPTTKRF